MAKVKLITEEKAPKPVKAKKERIAMPDAAAYLAQLRGMKGVKETDFSFFTDELAHATVPVKEKLPTGSLAIDRLIDGGWPIGRLVEVASWEGVGKTTLLDQSLAQVQRMGGIGVLIDSEQARDERYTSALGVDLHKLIIHKSLTIEDSFAGIDRIIAIQEAQTILLAKKGLEPPPMLIVWDSLGGTPSRAEYEGAADDKHVAEAARNVKMNLRRLTQRIASIRVCVVFSNHFYKTMGPFATLETYGGSGIKYFTSVRLFLSRTGQLKVSDTVVGHSIEVKLRKTRVSRPRPPAEIALIYGAGIHNSYTLYEWGKTRGLGGAHRWVKQAGAWSYLFPTADDTQYEAFRHTFMGLGEILSAKPDLYMQLVAAYIADGGSDEPALQSQAGETDA